MPWTREDLTRLVELEAHQQGVDPRLAVALAEQESGFNPTIRSPKGAYGIMQLMPGTAKLLGVNAQDPADNIRGGVTYFKQQLDAFGGDTKMALAAYNAGPGVVKAYGKVPPYKETQSYVSRILGKLGPASAEASPSQPQAPPQAAGMSRLQELEAHLARLEGQTAPQPPQASQAPAAAPDDQTHATDTMTRLRASRAGAAGLQPPPADMSALAVGGGPSQQAQPVTDPAALLAVGGGRAQPAVPQPQTPPTPAPMTVQGQIGAMEPLAPRAAQAIQGRVHEQGIPLSAVPAIAVNTIGTVGGAALGAPLGPVGSAAGAALGGSLATRANTAMGLAPQEKPLLETPWANVYPSDLLGAVPLGIAGATSALKGTVRNLPGANVGRHELAAEKLEQLGQRVGPARPSQELFTEAASQGGAVPMPTLWRAAGKVVREEKGMEKGFVSTEAMQAGSGLLSLMRKHGGNVPLEEVERYRQRLGQKIGTTTDKAELNRLQDLYAAIHQDLGLAATTGTTAGAGTLKAAIAAKRKEHAQETLTDVWSPGKGLQLQEGEHVQIYGKRIRNEVEKKLHQDKLFAGSFTPAEIVDMRNTLREVGKLTRVTNPDAQGTLGSTLKWLGRLGGAGYGATSGDLVTGGMMILATEGTSAVLARAMQSKLGRLALREAIREGNGKMTRGSLSAIAALLAREAAPEAPEPAPVQTP
jgi:hypothetical protein